MTAAEIRPLRLQFEFRDDQAGIVAEKLIDFEHRVGKRDSGGSSRPDGAKLSSMRSASTAGWRIRIRAVRCRQSPT